MRDRFLEAMSKAACSVYVVTTNGIGGRQGVTVSSVSSVSADTPQPTLLICIHKLSPAAKAIRANGTFCVNLLNETQSYISDTFAGRTEARDEGKFGTGNWTTGETGSPVLSDALVSFDCQVVHDLLCGSHHIFVGELQHITTSDKHSALVYSNRQYGRTSPLPETT